MSPLNRREFLFSSVAVSAATALAPHLSAMSAEGLWQPHSPASQKTYTGPNLLPQVRRNSSFVNWREQGLNFAENAYRNRQSLR